jgi:hypothetical protein
LHGVGDIHSSNRDWRPLYEAVLLETDSGKVPERITKARNAILDRIEECLAHPIHGEQTAMDDALRSLRRLAKIAADKSAV